jgi:hypothetical protein
VHKATIETLQTSKQFTLKDLNLSATAFGLQSAGGLHPALQYILIGMLKGLASIDIDQGGLLIAQTFSANRETLPEFRGQGIVAQERRLDYRPVGMVQAG